MSIKELTVKEVRELPIGTEVAVHGHDKYGYPTRLLCEIVETRGGRSKELRFSAWDGFRRMPIRPGKTYTVEVKENGDL